MIAAIAVFFIRKAQTDEEVAAEARGTTKTLEAQRSI